MSAIRKENDSAATARAANSTLARRNDKPECIAIAALFARRIGGTIQLMKFASSAARGQVPIVTEKSSVTSLRSCVICAAPSARITPVNIASTRPPQIAMSAIDSVVRTHAGRLDLNCRHIWRCPVLRRLRRTTARHPHITAKRRSRPARPTGSIIFSQLRNLHTLRARRQCPLAPLSRSLKSPKAKGRASRHALPQTLQKESETYSPPPSPSRGITRPAAMPGPMPGVMPFDSSSRAPARMPCSA
jgi:hypothetical protein